jgi:hypothetical protein
MTYNVTLTFASVPFVLVLNTDWPVETSGDADENAARASRKIDLSIVDMVTMYEYNWYIQD